MTGPVKSLLALVALLFAFTTLAPSFTTAQAASGSSTNAGKLGRSASSGVRRRAGGRVVRRKAQVSSRAGSKRASKRSAKRTAKKRTAKRSAKRRTAKKRTARKRTAGKRTGKKRAVRRTKRSGRALARKLAKRNAKFPAKRMVHVDRGPVEPALIKAAFAAKESGRLRADAPWECIPPELKAVLGQIAERWGTVTINSSHRSVAHNRKVGGKPRSFHLKCQAADFSVQGSHKGLVAFLKAHPLVGGYKRYRAGHFHIDTGPRRTW